MQEGSKLIPAAAMWLDREEPGWAGRIDLAYLDQGLGYACVAGQLSGLGATDAGLQAPWMARSRSFAQFLGLDSEVWADDMSFHSPFGSGGTDVWKDEIRVRLPKPPVFSGNTIALSENSRDEMVFTLDGDILTIVDADGDVGTINLGSLR